MHCVFWQDKRQVRLLTNYVEDKIITEKNFEYLAKHGIKVNKPMPLSVALYNQYTHGVGERYNSLCF